MVTSGARRRTRGQGSAWLLAALALAGCSDKYSAADTADASADAGSSPVDAGSDAPADLGPPDGPTCAAIKATRPNVASGRFVLDPDGEGGAPPFAATCDMVDDGGGWMLVTDAMIGDVQEVNATRVKTRGPEHGRRQLQAVRDDQGVR